jgi:hypothetical protein
MSVEHAWCVTKAGIVIDPTLPPPVETQTVRPQGYFGVPFSSKYVMETASKTGVYGILSYTNRNLFSGKIEPEDFLAKTAKVVVGGEENRQQKGLSRPSRPEWGAMGLTARNKALGLAEDANGRMRDAKLKELGWPTVWREEEEAKYQARLKEQHEPLTDEELGVGELSPEDQAEIEREEERQRQRDAATDAEIERYKEQVAKPLAAVESWLKKNAIPYTVKGSDFASRYLTVDLPNDEEMQIRFADHAQPTGIRGHVRGGFSETGEAHDASALSIDPDTGATAQDAIDLIKQRRGEENRGKEVASKPPKAASRLMQKRAAMADSELGKILKSLKPQFAAAAQKVYDEWDASDETYGDAEVGFGGICHLIVDEWVDLVAKRGYNATSFSHSEQVHVSMTVWANPPERGEDEDEDDYASEQVEVFDVDLNPYNYETGGGYNWKKIPDVTIDPNNISIYRQFVSKEDLQAIEDGF